MNQENEQTGASAAEGPRSEQRILSMHPDGNTSSSLEVTLRRRIDEIGQAIRDKDVDRLMTFYASDVVVFDVQPPLEARGADAYRQNFERWFASFEGPIIFELKNLRIVPGEFTAFCHVLTLIVGAKPDGRTSGYWARATTGFERRDGEWLVTHEHISMPAASHVMPLAKERHMSRKRPNEPIGPTTVPGEPTDPKIPPDQTPETDGRASKPKVTPLDEDKNIEHGIEVKET